MYRFVKLITAFILSAPVCLTWAAQDADFDVNPVMTYFDTVTLGQQSSTSSVFFTNTSGASLNIEKGAELSGPNADQFSIINDGCVTKTLTATGAGNNCSVEVAFTPSRFGSKLAMLSVAVNDASSSQMVAFLSSDEDTVTETQRRLSPTLESLSVPDVIDANAITALAWTVLGYESGYKASVALFDCSTVVTGECGDDFTENFWALSNIDADSSQLSSTWNYKGVSANEFNYSDQLSSADFASLSAGVTQVVMRLYIKPVDDFARGNLSASLLIPGNLVNQYYGVTGRKISLSVSK